MTDMQKLIKRARGLAVLADKATVGPWVEVPLSAGGNAIRMHHSPGKTWYGVELVKRDADAGLIAAAPEMAALLAELADALNAHRRALAVIAQELDGWGDVDLFERAFQIACARDPDYASGVYDPTPDDYAQALLDAVLVERGTLEGTK